MTAGDRHGRGVRAVRGAAFAWLTATAAIGGLTLTNGSATAQTSNDPQSQPQSAAPAVQPLTIGAAPPNAMPPVGAPTDEDIRDIRGPKYLAPAWLIPAALAAAVALLLLAYGIRRWLRRQRVPRVLSSSEAALQRLEEIRALMQPATVREFGIEVSGVVRRYIEGGFDITATHRTTEEFLHDLLATTHPALIGHRDLLAGFLEQCDLAKFAGMSLSAANMEALHGSARSFVIESSKPVAIAEARAA